MALVSDSHKFVYVMGGKCATGSVNGTLLSIPGITGFDPARQNANLWRMYSKHLPAKKIREMIGDVKWNEYFKFTFVRNTYPWIVSSFFFMVKIGMLKMPSNKIMTMKNFQEVINYYQSPAGRRHDNSYPIRSQKMFISDESGNVIVDYIGRVETLQKDFNNVCKQINVKSKPLPLCNTSYSSRGDWKIHYIKNPEAQQLIYYKLKIDIDYFKFKLDI